jgi:hypothetical protein
MEVCGQLHAAENALSITGIEPFPDRPGLSILSILTELSMIRNGVYQCKSTDRPPEANEQNIKFVL